MKKGAHGAPLLSPDEVRTKYITVHPGLCRLVLPMVPWDWLNEPLQEARKTCPTATIYGWPDGATVLWRLTKPVTEDDFDELVALYYEFHESVEKAKREGWAH